MKKILKNPILMFILGALLFGGVGTILAYKLAANQVSYTPSDSTWQVSDVDNALDSLFDMATYGDATSSDILEGKTALVNGNQVTGTLEASSISGGGKTICTYVDSEYGNQNDHYSVGTKYSCEVKENTRYNFYVLTNHTDSVDLIMEHNITELVGITKTMNCQTAMDYFRNGAGSALNWQVPVRLPEAQAIADAVGNTGWNTTEKDYNGWFCLGLHDQNSCINNGTWDKATAAGINAIAPYKWLINYTRECSAFGCVAATSLGEGEAYGYWTSDMVSKQLDTIARAWLVNWHGILSNGDLSNTTRYGVRPVISVYKSQMN